MPFLRLRIACGITFLAATIAVAQQPTYVVKRVIHLTRTADGFDGTLELLEDPRLTAQLDKDLWQSGGVEMVFDQSDPLFAQLTNPPLALAILRLKNDAGYTLQEFKLKRELARLDVEPLHPGYRSILVTTDLSAGFGSYSGPLTELFDVSHGKLDVVSARDPESATKNPIHLVSTLKTAWRLSASVSASPTERDLLEVACRPNADASAFFITYSRYHWSGTEWFVWTRKSRGMWEADEAFPPATKFPPAK